MADNEKPSWWRDALIIPLSVGLLVALGTFLLPKFFEKGKRLSYELAGPTPYVNATGLSGLSISFNGEPVNNAYGYRIRLWNSGDVPLSSLPVQFHFSQTSPEFKILNVRHETVPQQEFGKIDEQGSDKVSKRFVHELLNPSDEDTVTLVTNQEATPAVFAKANGLRVDRKVESKSFWRDYLGLAVAALAVISSLLTSALKFFEEFLVARLRKMVKRT